HAGEVPVVLPELQRPGARGGVAGARHRRRPAAGVHRVLRRRGSADLQELRDGPPRQMIDVHTHYVPRGMSTPADGPWVRDGSMIMLGDKEFRAIGPSSWDVDVRLADMDADGVSVQVVSPTPVFFGPDVDLARRANDEALALCARAPERLLPMCQVPLPDPD